MADALTSQVIQDGGRTAVLKYTNISDGSGQAAAVLVDASGLSADPVTRQACNVSCAAPVGLVLLYTLIIPPLPTVIAPVGLLLPSTTGVGNS